MIFTGDEILFFCLGVMTTLMVVGLIYWNKRYRIRKWVLPIIIFGFFLLLFCVAWSVSSLIEGEAQSARMGIQLFGLPAIILLVLGRRLVLEKYSV